MIKIAIGRNDTLIVNFETILAHFYNAFTAYCFSYNISHFQLFRRKKT